MDQKACKAAAEEIARNIEGINFQELIQKLIKYLPIMLTLCSMFASPEHVRKRAVNLLNRGKGPSARQRQKMKKCGIDEHNLQNKVWTQTLKYGSTLPDNVIQKNFQLES